MMVLAFVGCCSLTCAADVVTKPKRVALKVGDKAPTFVGTTEENKKWKSDEHAGKSIYVVYFYPADMTPGCTRQACNYRDALAALKRKDVKILGISGDSVDNHRLFKKAHRLNYTLLADPKGKIAEAFGVETGKGGSIERLIEGKKQTLTRGITARRWTFVLDKQWRIAYLDMSVDAAKDSEKVMKVIDKLK